ncbi:ThiF family adenylyltransferase [Microbacterium sp. KUDC0406]|uniref:ThiF family adenylyltransferase n=1 Tax=Microbacterium sp. KUDC0406 TaxID=2909588 RepID=UPI001F1EA915|nr:ThiF family adenylyltransferase [Microbacterium sp. KUDC0406]UJP09800.1 ThiF family adenylyltransferase [Microbacterium sp. KUDC0406]
MSPLVEPGPPLDPDRVSRYSRQLMLPGFGESAQRRLQSARVLVIGAGGLGSAVVPSLAAAGIGTIGIIDDDDVELSNLHRQLSHGVADIGRPKVDSLAETVAAIDPECRVITYSMRVRSPQLNLIMNGAERWDLLIDGSDNFPTRYLTNDVSVLESIPLVWGSILRFHGQVGVSWQGHGPTYRDLFPAPPPADEALSCELGGVLPTLCTAIGSFMATEAIKLITGIGEPLLGRVLFYDALTARTREIPYGASDDAPEITELIDYDLFCGMQDDDDLASVSAAELLGRLRAGEQLRLLDVREPHEADGRRIDGSTLLPIGDLRGGAQPDAGDGTLVVYCEKDPRSRSAARILLESGVDDVVYLAGGIQAFASVGGDTVSSVREAL